MTVGADNDAIGVVIGGKSLYDLARRGVYDSKAIANVLCHVNKLAVRRDCKARRIAGAHTVSSLCCGQFEFIRECGCAILPLINEERIGVAARDVQRAVVRREGSAVERAILWRCLRDLPRLQVNDLDALLAPAAEHDNGFVQAVRDHGVKRHAAKIDSIANRTEAHAGRQRRGKDRSLYRRRCTQQGGQSKSDSAETTQTYSVFTMTH